MIAWTFISALTLTPAATSGCSEPVRPSFDVVLGVQPVSVSSDMPLADLAALAARSHAPLRHPAYGYYVGTFGYSIKVIPASNEPCSKDFRVRILMGLGGRHIEIAHELQADRCLYSNYLQHYEKHAASDVALIADYSRRVANALRSTPMRLQPGRVSSGDQMSDEVRKTIDKILVPLTSDRVAISRQIDSNAEVETLRHVCASSSGTAAPSPI